MAGKGPSILVIADDRHERALIVSTLREAGFAVATPAGSVLAALRRERFAATVVALAEDDALAAVAELRDVQPGLPAVLVVEPAQSRVVDEDCVTLVKRPLDPRRLLGMVVELVLREDDVAAPMPRHGNAAELGIAAARLACLCNRRTVAAATGAARLAQDLTRQISEMRTMYRGLTGTPGGLAIGGCAG